jgi:type I restriction-modification system DNA methylase subunit
MMAEISLQDAAPIIEENGFVTISEPAAGAGGMLLAAADVLAHRGHDPSLHMLAHAADLSTLCYHMCFLQLTLRGIPALVERANSLSLERFEAAWTPPVMPFYERHGKLFPPKDPEEAKPSLPKGGQMSLFEE